MESKEKNTKEKILEEALKLFAQSGYMGTSMNDIASKLGVTKAALYKHYKSKQEILDSIIEKMNELDIERVKQYEMPEGDLEKVTAEYKETAFDKIKQFTKVQFLHWTEEEFSSCFRKMLTLEQYREPQMAQLYQNYLARGPLTYMEALLSGMLDDEGKSRRVGPQEPDQGTHPRRRAGEAHEGDSEGIQRLEVQGGAAREHRDGVFRDAVDEAVLQGHQRRHG